MAAPSTHFLGLQTKWEQGRGTVASILSAGAGESAGIAAGDELIAVNGVRVPDAEKFNVALKNAMRAGRDLELIVSRLDRVLTRKVRWRKHEGVGVEILPG